MFHKSFAISLMLMASIHLFVLAVSAKVDHQYLHSEELSITARDILYTPTATVLPCTGKDCITATPSSRLPCHQIDGIEIAGNNSIWTILCDTDFFAQDIYPFILAKTFEECLRNCEDYNEIHGESKCAGFVFAPDRVNLDNSCYLKSGLNDMVSPATIHLIGASLHPLTATVTSLLPFPLSSKSISTVTAESSIITPPKIGEQEPSFGQQFQQGKRPTVLNSTYLGSSVDKVASQYISHPLAKPPQIGADMLEVGINIDLITNFPLAPDTGSWTDSDSSSFGISTMKVKPRLSRDGGRGGKINGTNIFIFCDTSTFGEEKDPVLGYLNGFVSSSVAVDNDMNALKGEPLSLVNPLGQWQDDVGRMRGWVPMTTGEEAFNIAISGRGYRYAVWPNASPIPLNNTHSIMHAPLVYLEVDMQDQSSPRYTGLGNTLLLISVDPVYGPHADRLHNQFFQQREVNWGSLGGIRAWGSKGQDSLDGDVYVFGQAENGILVGRVAARDFDDRNKYSFWDGQSWSIEMPPPDSSPNAVMIDQPVMNMDLIYSPAHKTFIMIYLTPQADNTFYYRYLMSKDNQTLRIEPPYEDGGDDDYVAKILTNTWSQEKVLFSVPVPQRGYAYAGGIHAGYFGGDDIANGGRKMLCTWTEHTSINPDQPNSGYAHKSQVVELGFEDQA